MKKVVIIVVCIIAIIFMIGYFALNNSEYQEELVPEEEITDDELRNTIITLYFENKDSGEIQTEARLIDSKDLLDNPYEYLVNLLIEGPKNENLRKVIPEGAKLKNATLVGECLVLNFTKEFLENSKGDAFVKSNLLYTIIDTVTELKEVSRVKFLIEDEECEGFSDVGISFKKEFIKTNGKIEQQN